MIAPAWLIEREERYGGYVEMEHANGGDRMSVHGYADAYASALSAFVERNGRDVVCVEIGVLRGTGLAMWGDLFGTVIGLDWNLQPFRDYRDELEARGAFKDCHLRVAPVDQHEITAEQVESVLWGRKASVVIDDGSHEDEATLRTLDAFRPHLADDFLYFVEDQPRHSNIHALLQKDPLGLTATRLHRSLTVLTP